MAYIKIKFSPSATDGGRGAICYQIIHDRKTRRLKSGHIVSSSEWDERRSMVRIDHRNERETLILLIREQVNRDVERLTKIINRLNASGIDFTVDDVVDEFRRYTCEYSLFNFMASVIKKLKINGRIRTSETYTSSLNSFKTFRQGEDIMLDALTPDIVEAYGAWLRRRGVALNTISFYARILRAVYNRAVDQGAITNLHPFKRIYTGVDKTVKRALPLAAIKKMKILDLSRTPSLDYARDMFLLSFYLRGMSFIDMAFLRKSDLKNGYITYRRRKTGQSLIIEWTKEMQSILDKYPTNKTHYLMPIIRSTGLNERSAYRNMGYKINYNLKRIAEQIGIRIPLTLYVARHSWASVAKSKGIPISVISEGMGHNSESTTQIYLTSLDTAAVDRANSIILRSL